MSKASGLNALEYADELWDYVEGDYSAAVRVLNNSFRHYNGRMTQEYRDDTLYALQIRDELKWLD